jgi:hypothetical protein
VCYFLLYFQGKKKMDRGIFNMKRKGQSTLEFLALIAIVLGVFIAVGTYFKRGIQGRWKEAVDGLGEQYDPRVANTDITDGLTGVTETRVTALLVNGGIWTLRDDTSNMLETKTGSTRIGAF